MQPRRRCETNLIVIGSKPWILESLRSRAFLRLNTRLFRNCLDGVTDEQAAMRPRHRRTARPSLRLTLSEARFYLLQMLGDEQPSPLAAYLEGARGIDDVKRFPPLAEIQRAWTTASHALRDRLDTVTAAELDAPIVSPIPLPISRPDGVEPADVLRAARQLPHRAVGAPQETRGSPRDAVWVISPKRHFTTAGSTRRQNCDVT